MQYAASQQHLGKVFLNNQWSHWMPIAEAQRWERITLHLRTQYPTLTETERFTLAQAIMAETIKL